MESCTGTVRDVQQPSEGSSSDQGTTPTKKFNLKHLINKINYIHFLDGTITASFRHKRYATSLSVLLKPQPCTDENLVCNWENTLDLEQKLQHHRFQHFLINDGQKTLLVEPKAVEINGNELHFVLPQEYSELNSRKIRRHPCTDISAQLIQNGSCFQGKLIDFSVTALHIKVEATPPQTFQWLNPESTATLILTLMGKPIYSTECHILKQSCGQNMRSVIVNPSSDRIFKFKPKKHRSTRQKLNPSPNIIFKHPLTGKSIDLEVVDISGSGLSVIEKAHDSILLPGLIIPELTLAFTNSDSLTCKAQVVYRIDTNNSAQPNTVRCGLAFLDMKLEQQTRLLSIIYHTENKHSYLNNRIDLNALWKFFFDTGFIYPEKYLHFESEKLSFKKTYETLYEKKPNIARHFTYQDKGTILAHMSMVRFYSNSWLVQHHASWKTETRKGGLSVLSYASRYANEIYRLYSAHLDFLICYFRPENRFPQRAFGGVAKHINNPKGCSIDSFAYFHFKKSFNEKWDSIQPCSISRTDLEDLQELKLFIDHHSGGLMVPALDLDSLDHNQSNLFTEYRKNGLKREQHHFSIKIKGILKAVVVLNISESFLNISNLTNCFKVIVIDSEGLTKRILFLMLSMLCIRFSIDNLPVLIYPTKFAEQERISIEKVYNLFILNMQYMDSFFDFFTKIIPGFSSEI